MAQSTGIPLAKTTRLEEVIKENNISENLYQSKKANEDGAETESKNIPSQEDPNWSYTGSVWPMPRQQVFKELANQICTKSDVGDVTCHEHI